MFDLDNYLSDCEDSDTAIPWAIRNDVIPPSAKPAWKPKIASWRIPIAAGEPNLDLAARDCLLSGTDIDSGGTYSAHLANAVQAGLDRKYVESALRNSYKVMRV